MGKRIDLATLATADGPSGLPALAGITGLSLADGPPTVVQLHQVAANPINPRENFGDLTDLESMRTVGQLQPCAVVRRSAFAAIYPEYAVDAVEFVIVAGSRRRAAALKFGLDSLTVTVLDQLAASRAQFYAASVAENIDRRNFDVLEEAHAVQRLVKEIGSGTEAGAILGRTKGWVSQRLALLKLSLPMRDLLRAGELPVRDARRLAALNPDEQLSAWHEERRVAEVGRFTAVNGPSGQRGPGAGSGAAGPTAADGGSGNNSNVPGTAATAGVGRRSVTVARGATVQQIADGLRESLSGADLSQLAYALLRYS
jgi:ParB family transcriptional regulator, chromosome partitioning protein